jgi:peptidoglycan-N-acetylglucosamine deacetylase
MIVRLLVATLVATVGIGGTLTAHLHSPAVSAFEDAEPGRVFFPETGQYVSGEVLDYWQRHGGLQMFGYPITGEVSRQGRTVQYFERAVFEIHPENEPEWRIMLRRLGAEAAQPEYRMGPAFKPVADPGTGAYFQETGHGIAPLFVDFWEANGGLNVFGFPISQAFQSNGRTIQYFERAVFEHHATNPQGWTILQPRLGYEAAVSDGVDMSPRPHDGRTVLYDPALRGQGGPGAEDMVVYLTFDDGPDPRWTPQVLEILRKYNAKATFFVLGQSAAIYPDIISNIAREGHVLANHTYNHASMAGMSFATFEWQLRETERAVPAKLLSPCMRPPYGAMDSNTRPFSERLGYDVILWDVDPNDWQRPGARTIADRVVGNVKPGHVVLLHDGGIDRSQTVEALEMIMEELHEQGYRFEAICR